MWEYQRLEFEIFKLIDLDIELTKLGSDNWEIIYYNEEKPKSFGQPLKVVVVLKKDKNQHVLIS